MSMQPEHFVHAVLFVLGGVWVTLWIVLCVLAISTPGAVIVACIMQSRFALLRGLLTVASALVRGIPPMLMMFGAYFVLPVFGVVLTAMQAAIFSLSLYILFYFSECIRAGLAAIPAGQYDAIRALGLPRLHGFCRILLPQSIPVILPPFMGYVTEVVKGSALASAISVAEVTGNGYQMIMATGRPLSILMVMAAIYTALNGIALGGQALFMRRLNRRAS